MTILIQAMRRMRRKVISREPHSLQLSHRQWPSECVDHTRVHRHVHMSHWMRWLQVPLARHRVHFSAQHRCFVQRTDAGTERRFRGLVPTLRARFCRTDAPPEGPVIRAPSRITGPRSGSRRGMRGGCARGRLVDRQLAVAVALLAQSRHAWTVRDILHPRASPPGQPALQARHRRWRATLHAYTYRVLRYLADHDWEPVGAQVPVAHGPCRLATAVDLVCVPRAELRSGGGPGTRVALFEIKTGFQHRGYDGPVAAHLRPPFQAWPDTHRNRHQLQWLGTCLLFRTAFRTRHWVLEGGGILRVDDAGVHAYLPTGHETLDVLRSTLLLRPPRSR